MSTKPSLFDDDSEEEYVPPPTEEVPQQVENVQAEAQNPYDQAPQQHAYGEEQQPYQEEPVQNPYGDPEYIAPEEKPEEYYQQQAQPEPYQQTPVSEVVEEKPNMIETKQEEVVQVSKPALSESELAKLRMLKELGVMTEDSTKDIQPSEEEDRINRTFAVIDPVKVGSTVKYTVQGNDSQGPFEVQRRFNEFNALRLALTERWPGCYVPYIPEKAMIAVDKGSGGNVTDWKLQSQKEGAFVEMRRALFERFLRELAKYDYLVESREFQLFVHEIGEVDKKLAALPKQQPMQILEKYRLNFKLDEEQEQTEIAKCREKINTFIIFLKKADASMEKAKDSMKEMDNHGKSQHENYQRMYTAFMKYEDIALEYFSDSDSNKRVLTHPNAGDVTQKVKDAHDQIKNPFTDAYIWIRGEQLDMKGMQAALMGRETVMRSQIALEQKKRENESELSKLETGKSSFKNFFKSKGSKEDSKMTIKATVDTQAQQIDDYRKLVNFITILHGQNAINRFKKDKVLQYKRMLRGFSVREITNMHVVANLCHHILQQEEGKKEEPTQE